LGTSRFEGGEATVIRTILVSIAFIVGWSFAVQSAIYSVCLYLWIAYFRPESWAWSGVFASLNLSFLAGVFLLVRAFASPTRFRLDFRNSLLLLFLAHALLSSLLSTDVTYSLSYLQDFAKVVVVSYLLSVLITSAADFRLVLLVIALSLGFEAGKQGWAQLILNPGAANANSIPFLGDNNLVAVGMTMLLPMVGALASTSTGWQKRAFQFLAIGVLYRAISTYSRGGLLAVATVGLIYFVRSPNKLRTVVAFAVSIALILPVLPQQYWDRMSTITSPADERDDSQSSRLHFWQVAVSMANDRPLLGVGHRGFERTYNQYDWTGGRYGLNRAVHSAWFGILAEGGYPGLVIFVALFLSSMFSCRRVRLLARRGAIPEALGRYAISLEAALASFAIGGAFVSFHYCEMLWHFFALTMALEVVAAKEALAITTEAARPKQQSASVTTQPVEPDFVWG
jgi:probable O-glycosylation ligase (exosortase A-associated)